MKINNTRPPIPIHGGGQNGPTSRASEATTKSGAGSSSSLGQMNAALLDTKHDIDSLRVNEVRQAIIDGKLEIDAGKIAQGLLENLKRF